MKNNTDPLQPDTFYHIYNRGINRENIFKEKNNYLFFLEKYKKYILPVAHTFSYCLLKNHFHLLIRTRSEDEIRTLIPLKERLAIEKIISLQFSHLFNGYAQAVNKSFERTGGLFETPFRRIAVHDQPSLTRLICYIHSNPQKHGFTDDFTTYPYSSYPSYLSNKPTGLERDTALEWFGNKEGFIEQHEGAGSNLDLEGGFD